MNVDEVVASPAGRRFGALTRAKSGCCLAGWFSVCSGVWVGVKAASALPCAGEDVLECLCFPVRDVWLLSLSETGEMRGHRDFTNQRAVGEGS